MKKTNKKQNSVDNQSINYYRTALQQGNPYDITTTTGPIQWDLNSGNTYIDTTQHNFPPGGTSPYQPDITTFFPKKTSRKGLWEQLDTGTSTRVYPKTNLNLDMFKTVIDDLFMNANDVPVCLNLNHL